MMGIVKAVGLVGDIHQGLGEDRWFMLVRGALKVALKPFENTDQISGFGIVESGEINVFNGWRGCQSLVPSLSQDAAKAGIAIHDIGAGFTIEVQDAVPIECPILDAPS